MRQASFTGVGKVSWPSLPTAAEKPEEKAGAGVEEGEPAGSSQLDVILRGIGRHQEGQAVENQE